MTIIGCFIMVMRVSAIAEIEPVAEVPAGSSEGEVGALGSAWGGVASGAFGASGGLGCAVTEGGLDPGDSGGSEPGVELPLVGAGARGASTGGFSGTSSISRGPL